MRFAPAVLCVVAMTGAAGAEQQGTDVRLEFGALPDSCPSEAWLRSRVADHLPETGAHTPTGRVLRAELREIDSGFVATIQWVDATGQTHAQRDLESNQDCEEVAAATALAMAMAIDPLGVRAVETPALETQVVAIGTESIAKPAETTPPATIIPKAKRSRTVGLGAGAFLSYGLLDTIRPGGSLRGQYATTGLSLEAQASLLRASSVRARDASVDVALYHASVEPCFLPRPWGACLTLAAGMVRSRGNEPLVAPKTANTPYLGVGTRLVYELLRTRSTTLRLATEARLNLLTTELRVSGQTIETLPRIGLTVGIDGFYQL